MKHSPILILLADLSRAALSLAALSLAALSLAVLPLAAQPAAQPLAAQPVAVSPTAAVPTPLPPSAQLRPSLSTVEATLSGLRVDKWKRGSVRDEAADDIQAIQHEIRVNMPPLITASDAAPRSVSKALPVAKHAGALYDVLLRVYDASRIVAPAQQVGELQSALHSLERARLGLDSRLQTIASAQEEQMSALRVTVQKQAAFKCPAPPPAKPCPKPRVHHYRRHHSTKTEEKKKTESTAKPQTQPKQ